ncbi:hypothetical protein [Novosphingobium sp. CCH12-A3]|uniref:hypothetical protein n=1 Tax=Novosphingobium sp. CCH12-A3 TaxID=1768752 RepID=UPI000AB5E7F9|nr:hypothetical protein [Novosphingobium sp. CCH12-A3]
MQYPQAIRDRQADYVFMFERRLAQKLATTITERMIEEHRRKPLGQHSDALERVLNFFRRGGLAGKVGIFQPDPARPVYRLIRFPGVRGGSATIIDGEPATSLAEAHHAAFLQRIADLNSQLAGDEA